MCRGEWGMHGNRDMALLTSQLNFPPLFVSITGMPDLPGRSECHYILHTFSLPPLTFLFLSLPPRDNFTRATTLPILTAKPLLLHETIIFTQIMILLYSHTHQNFHLSNASRATASIGHNCTFQAYNVASLASSQAVRCSLTSTIYCVQFIIYRYYGIPHERLVICKIQIVTLIGRTLTQQ